MTPTETKARRERDKLTKELGPSGVMRQITDYLEAEQLHYSRFNSGVAKRDGRWIKLQNAGTPDLLVIIPDGRSFCWDFLEGQHGIRQKSAHAVPFYIEVKRPKGGRRTQEQINFAEYMLSIGAIHVWATDVEDVMKVLPPRLK